MHTYTHYIQKLTCTYTHTHTHTHTHIYIYIYIYLLKDLLIFFYSFLQFIKRYLPSAFDHKILNYDLKMKKQISIKGNFLWKNTRNHPGTFISESESTFKRTLIQLFQLKWIREEIYWPQKVHFSPFNSLNNKRV